MTNNIDVTKIPENKRVIAERLIVELQFIGTVMDSLKLKIEEDGTIECTNTGYKEATALTSYVKLISRYQSLYRQLCGLMDENDISRGADPLTEWLRDE